MLVILKKKTISKIHKGKNFKTEGQFTMRCGYKTKKLTELRRNTVKFKNLLSVVEKLQEKRNSVRVIITFMKNCRM